MLRMFARTPERMGPTIRGMRFRSDAYSDGTRTLFRRDPDSATEHLDWVPVDPDSAPEYPGRLTDQLDRTTGGAEHAACTGGSPTARRAAAQAWS
jgi:hypothetical protein